MSKTYELWDSGSRNLIGAYSSEADALTYVRRYVADYGPAYARTWVLLWDDDPADQAGQIAEGQALLDLAERARSAHEVSAAHPTRRVG
jgi:hypothetical protein